MSEDRDTPIIKTIIKQFMQYDCYYAKMFISWHMLLVFKVQGLGRTEKSGSGPGLPQWEEEGYG